MTRKPCPSCGEVVSHRKVNDICYKCRNKFEEYDKIINTLSNLQSQPELMEILVGVAPHWNQFFYLAGHQISSCDFPRELQQLFLNLVLSVSTEIPILISDVERTNAIRILGKCENTYQPGSYRSIKKETGLLIKKLHEIIPLLTQEMFQRGAQKAEDAIQKVNEIRKIITF